MTTITPTTSTALKNSLLFFSRFWVMAALAALEAEAADFWIFSLS